jgi:hypothetical protein
MHGVSTNSVRAILSKLKQRDMCYHWTIKWINVNIQVHCWELFFYDVIVNLLRTLKHARCDYLKRHWIPVCYVLHVSNTLMLQGFYSHIFLFIFYQIVKVEYIGDVYKQYSVGTIYEAVLCIGFYKVDYHCMWWFRTSQIYL